MKIRTQVKFVLTVFSVLFVLGCAQNSVSLVKAGKVSVDRVSTGHVKFPSVDVYRKDDTTVVRGTIRQRSLHKHPMSGHVDVQLIDSNGQVIEQGTVPIKPHRLSRFGPRQARFEVPLNTMPPDGAVVRVQYGQGAHSPTKDGQSSTE